MYSPYGGAVIGRYKLLNEHMPEFYGGGIVKLVTDYTVKYKDAPDVYEAGSPNYPGVVGMAKAMEILKEVGFDAIAGHEKVLNKRLIDGLKKLPGIILYGDCENIDDRVGVVTFNFEDINSFVLAGQLSNQGGVATRRGAFCAHPYVWRMMGIDDETAKTYENCIDRNTPGMIRVSFGIYNNEEEVDQFLKILESVLDASRLATKADSLAIPGF